MDIGAIEHRLSQREDVDLGNGASLEEVHEAEDFFGNKFPADFREFLLRWGWASIEAEEFLGLGGAAHLNIVLAAKSLGKGGFPAEFKNFLVPARRDGYGNCDVIDNSITGETSVIRFWQHDKPTDPAEMIAKGYWEWFSDVIDMIEENEGESQR